MVDLDTKAADQAIGPPPGKPGKARFLGVDVTRGIALICMLAANVFDNQTADGRPTLALMTVIGPSATLFAMVAGISMAFISGGRHPMEGRARRAARANIAVRALMISAIGLALAYVAPADLGVILTYYGMFFLLAIPLIGLRPRTLAGIAAGLVVVSPLILLASYFRGWQPVFDGDPTLTAPFTNPIGLATQLLVTGDYPAVVYLAYICAGLAIGRLDLSSTKVAVRLLVGGVALTTVAWFTSSVLLFHLGGLQHLLAASPQGTSTTDIVWDASSVPSWWWLTIRAHHTGTPFDMLRTLGLAMAVLGAVLLVTKLVAARRLLRPVALAGAMTLTIYSAHAVVLATPLLEDNDMALWLLLVVGGITFAVLWHHWLGQGPLERLVAIPADRARQAVLNAPARTPGDRRRGITARWRPAVPTPRTPVDGPQRKPSE